MNHAIVFSSVIFLFFFLPATLATYMPLQVLVNRNGGTGLPLFGANAWLLLVSLVFYAWGEPYLVSIMLVSCLLNYAGGIGCGAKRPYRRWALILTVVANLTLLGWFKYSGLLADVINQLDDRLGHLWGIKISWETVVLPLGISFYTFHGISYVIDVWREKITPCRNLVDFMCYSTLFPQLVAGPIVRYSEVAQYISQRCVHWADLGEGAKRFVIGLGKKALLANQMALLADGVFNLPSDQRTSAAAWVGLIGYALQIYFDFSGYSDMAIGLGRMFGFRFPENFNHPYVAISVRDFWRRWHMTLSRFFRDYLYIPLGGNRRSRWRTALNLFAVFGLCGLWHGASLTFVAWGLFHGGFIAAERMFEKTGKTCPDWLRPVGHVYTLAVVLIGWAIFRCDTWSQATAYLHTLFGAGASGGLEVLPTAALNPSVWLAGFLGIAFSMPIAPTIHVWCANRPTITPWLNVAKMAGVFSILVLSLITIGAGAHNPFIYYRF